MNHVVVFFVELDSGMPPAATTYRLLPFIPQVGALISLLIDNVPKHFAVARVHHTESDTGSWAHNIYLQRAGHS